MECFYVILLHYAILLIFS